jgi:hypothetical protein
MSYPAGIDLHKRSIGNIRDEEEPCVWLHPGSSRNEHSVQDRSRTSLWPYPTCTDLPARSRRAGPVTTRMLPTRFRAKARAEGPCLGRY